MAALNIGVEKETVEVLRDTVLAILDASGDREVICKAFDVLLTGCRVERTMVSNCTFFADKEED